MKSETEDVGRIGRGRDMDRSSGNVQGASQSADREDDEGNIYADGWLGERKRVMDGTVGLAMLMLMRDFDSSFRRRN
jgi:hypothetical protein